MTTQPKTISVLFSSREVELQVEEFCPYEPSNYQWDAGWRCFDERTEAEYFVNMSGEVYNEGNVVVGVAPEIKAAADKLEAEMERSDPPC